MENTDIYSRQREKYVPPQITIIGCGGTGFWAGIFFALLGTKKFYLHDADRIEASNLNRLPVSENSLGQLKIIILKNTILSLRKDAEVECFPSFIVSSTSKEGIEGLICDCTDNVQSQEIIKEICRNKNLQYLRMGCSDDSITISKDVSPNEWADTTASGYEIIPSWVGTNVLSAIAGVMLVAGNFNVILRKE